MESSLHCPISEGGAGRPVIASSKIDAYDGDSVTFHYNRHEDNQLVTETVLLTARYFVILIFVYSPILYHLNADAISYKKRRYP